MDGLPPIERKERIFSPFCSHLLNGCMTSPYFCSTELYRFLGGNGQFSPTKFQTTFFQQKNNWKTNWNILQPSKHPGAARFLSSKPRPFCLRTCKHVFYGPGASCTGSSCWTQTKRLQASWGNAIKILWSHSPSLEMPVYTALQKGQLWNLKPASHVKKKLTRCFWSYGKHRILKSHLY